MQGGRMQASRECPVAHAGRAHASEQRVPHGACNKCMRMGAERGGASRDQASRTPKREREAGIAGPIGRNTVAAFERRASCVRWSPAPSLRKRRMTTPNAVSPSEIERAAGDRRWTAAHRASASMG